MKYAGFTAKELRSILKSSKSEGSSVEKALGGKDVTRILIKELLDRVRSLTKDQSPPPSKEVKPKKKTKPASFPKFK